MPADPELDALARHATASRLERWKREEAPKIWADWHRHALQVDAGAVSFNGEEQWLAELLARVLCGTCKVETAKEVQRLLADRPWERGEYFAATVHFHARAGGDAQLSIDQARQIWSA